MPNKLMLPRRWMQIILMALAAASSHSINAQSEYATLRRFFEDHPDQQVFELSIRKETNKHGS